MKEFVYVNDTAHVLSATTVQAWREFVGYWNTHVVIYREPTFFDFMQYLVKTKKSIFVKKDECNCEFFHIPHGHAGDVVEKATWYCPAHGIMKKKQAKVRKASGPHETIEDYCCACSYDIAVMQGKITMAKQQMVDHLLTVANTGEYEDMRREIVRYMNRHGLDK